MKIVCPACQRPIAGVDVDLAAGRALCRPCGELVLLPVGAAAGGAAPPAEVAPKSLAQASPAGLARPMELSLWEEALPHGAPGVELTASRGTPLRLHGAVTAVATTALAAAVMVSAIAASISLEVALIAVLALVGPTVPLSRLFHSGREHRVRLDERGLTHLPYRSGPEIHEPLDNIRQFVVDLRLDHLRLGELPVVVSEWPVRMLTGDGRAVELRLGLRSEDEVRYVAGRLNRALEALRAPLGYRG